MPPPRHAASVRNCFNFDHAGYKGWFLATSHDGMDLWIKRHGRWTKQLDADMIWYRLGFPSPWPHHSGYTAFRFWKATCRLNGMIWASIQPTFGPYKRIIPVRTPCCICKSSCGAITACSPCNVPRLSFPGFLQNKTSVCYYLFFTSKNSISFDFYYQMIEWSL